MGSLVLVLSLLFAQALSSPPDVVAAFGARPPDPRSGPQPQQPQPPQGQQPQQPLQQHQSPAVRMPPPPAPPKDQQSTSAGTSGTQGESIDSVVSIDRIRKALERQPALTFVMPDPNVPRYRIEIQGGTFKPANFLSSFYIPPTPTPVPFGGVDYYELQRLNTPPEFWGSAPFTNKDLLGMAALNGAYSLVGALVKKGLEARASAAQSRAHQEVLQELKELADHNARAAAGQADPSDGSDKKPPEKKPEKKDKKK